MVLSDIIACKPLIPLGDSWTALRSAARPGLSNGDRGEAQVTKYKGRSWWWMVLSSRVFLS